MAYWMKDVVQDLEQFCELNNLGRTYKSLELVEQVLDEEIRLREDTELFPATDPAADMTQAGT